MPTEKNNRDRKEQRDRDRRQTENRNRKETVMLSRLYISITTYIKYNQKVAAEGDDQLAEPTLPILFKSVMFEY